MALTLLIQYQDAKENYDIEKMLSCLDDQGEFSFECGLMVLELIQVNDRILSSS